MSTSTSSSHRPSSLDLAGHRHASLHEQHPLPLTSLRPTTLLMVPAARNRTPRTLQSTQYNTPRKQTGSHGAWRMVQRYER